MYIRLCNLQVMTLLYEIVQLALRVSVILASPMLMCWRYDSFTLSYWYDAASTWCTKVKVIATRTLRGQRQHYQYIELFVTVDIHSFMLSRNGHYEICLVGQKNIYNCIYNCRKHISVRNLTLFQVMIWCQQVLQPQLIQCCVKIYQKELPVAQCENTVTPVC